MPKIETYNFDENISDNDFLLGTDVDEDNKTKSYKIRTLINKIKAEVELTAFIQVETLPIEDIQLNTIYILPNGDWNYYNGTIWLSNSNRPYKVYTATLRFSRTGSDISTYALENTIGDITISRINNSIVFESPQFETGNVYVVPSTLKSYNGSVTCFGELCSLQKDSFTFTDSIKRTPGIYNFPNGVWFEIDNTLFDGVHDSYIKLFTNVEIRVYN